MKSEKCKIENVSFESLIDKQIWILKGIIDSLDYIGKETNISNTENELKKLSIKQLNQVIDSMKNRRFRNR